MNRLLLVICCGLVLAAGCGKLGNPNVVGLDLLHGVAWPSAKAELEQLGFRVVLLQTNADFRDHQRLGVLIILTDEPGATKPLGEKRATAIADFVRTGGGLLCAGEAWSWITEKGASRSLEDFSLNVLGRHLGFTVLDRTTRDPRNISPSLLGGLDGVNRTDWWASEIRATAEGAEPLITDEELRPMAVRFPYGRGRVVVVGHRELLRENPDVLRNILLYLSGLDEHVL